MRPRRRRCDRAGSTAELRYLRFAVGAEGPARPVVCVRVVSRATIESAPAYRRGALLRQHTCDTGISRPRRQSGPIHDHSPLERRRVAPWCGSITGPWRQVGREVRRSLGARDQARAWFVNPCSPATRGLLVDQCHQVGCTLEQVRQVRLLTLGESDSRAACSRTAADSADGTKTRTLVRSISGTIGATP